MLDLLGVRPGDAVRIRFDGQRMIVTPPPRVATDAEFDAAMEARIDENDEVVAPLRRVGITNVPSTLVTRTR